MVHLTLFFIYTTQFKKIFLVSRAISYIMSALFYPIITFFLLAICIAYWAVIAVYPPNCWFLDELSHSDSSAAFMQSAVVLL